MAMKEIRWHARGGQGAKTAATVLAHAALTEGKYGQGFPEYGPERMGAPIRGFTRVSDEPIRMHCQINHPDVVVVLDESLLASVDVCDGLSEDGIVIVNTAADPSVIREQLDWKGNGLFVVNANQIAIDEIGRPIPNAPMMGALIKTTAIVRLDTLLKDMEKKFSGSFSSHIVEGNLKAIERAYKEVRTG